MKKPKSCLLRDAEHYTNGPCPYCSTEPHELEAYLDRAIVLVKQGWCQGAYARDRHGDSCSPAGMVASQWSVDGALIRAACEKNLHPSEDCYWAVHNSRMEVGITLKQDWGIAEFRETWQDRDNCTSKKVIKLLRDTKLRLRMRLYGRRMSAKGIISNL